METVCDAATGFVGIDAVSRVLGDAMAAGVSPVSADDAAGWIYLVETLRRRVEALQVEVLAAVDSGGWHSLDGHFSPKKMLEHHACLSPGSAAAVERTRRMFIELRGIQTAFNAGSLGVDHVGLLAKVCANKRVRDAMADAQGWFLEQAGLLSYRDFEQLIREWERLVDADGVRDRNQHNHENRNATLTQDQFSLGWKLEGRWASLAGSEIEQVLRAYVKTEYEADWDKARAEYGPNATVADLARTAAQRRADALARVFADAANSGTTIAAAPIHNIVWTAETYQAMLAALEHETSPTLDVETHRCSTLDGIPLDPTECAVSSLVSRVRRVVVDAAEVVIDMGTARFFTGSARHAALMNSPTCIWPGCHIMATDCQVDHLTEHSRGGRTNPGNGAPLCGKHNRHKHNHRYTIKRDPSGGYAILRPDGTLVT